MLTHPAYQPRSLRGGLQYLRMGYLILKLASRCMLSAVIHTQLGLPVGLTSNAPGVTTGTPLAGPFRSSRTRNRSPQPNHIIGPVPTKDRDQTVSRPLYKIVQTQLTYHFLIGEQSNLMTYTPALTRYDEPISNPEYVSPAA